ncbi:MAG: oligoribonuclease [Thiomonas sp. 13-66-29]|jgi:oligoribonuclease|uniref:oligoribonuclease n=1 Tax=Thiomonas sp. TaxID=2047785 RepID=UPI000BD4795D|nr:oligoribonuclease [Thiomonas sp.]OZB45240.1 MAG: oligoribonuclease [Thiomonas sp. 15-66-11]OZB65916.1 MAG: oligoribonuclease [Thiomonas sp. 13-66-29]
MSLATESAVLAPHESNLLWVDMEMTGLNPDTDRIIEVAIVVTDAQVRTRVEGPVLVVHQDAAVMDAMDAWNKGTHGRSGLITKVAASALDERQVEQQLLDFIARYVPAGKSPMCGNSICQDRRFMARWMPRLEAYFHYRNVDVSTLKELARRWRPEVCSAFKKRQEHTALADIHESIDELLHYREHFLQAPPPSEAAPAAA